MSEQKSLFYTLLQKEEENVFLEYKLTCINNHTDIILHYVAIDND